VLAGKPPLLRLAHVWVRPDVRRQGLGRAVMELVRARASSSGVTVLAVDVPAGDAAMVALTAGTKVLGERLSKRVVAGGDLPDGFGWRPLAPDELTPWQDAQVQAYAEDNLPRSGGDLVRALERARSDFSRLLPQGLATPDTSLVVLTSGGEQVGHLWLAHHREPGLSYVFDVEVAEQHRGRGFGRAAMVVAEVLARDAGDETIGLHVFGGNATARRLYRTHGYAVVSADHDLLAREDPR
jgi:ribosomal protein S18 acetylase RimI-like enzyme